MLLADGTGFASWTWIFRYSLSTILECGSLLSLFCLPVVAVAMRVFVGAGLAPPIVLAAGVVVEGSPFLVAVILSEAKYLKPLNYRLVRTWFRLACCLPA